MNSSEGKFQGESEGHSMDWNAEIQNMISGMLQGFRDMTLNIILFGQDTIEFLVKHMDNKNGEGGIHGSQHKERRIPKGFVFSSNGPHNLPNEFTKDPSIQLIPTMPKFLDQ